MKMRTRVLFAVAVACVLAVLTGLLLLSGNVRAAIWMEGPYFPLTLLLPGSVDRLATMLVVVMPSLWWLTRLPSRPRSAASFCLRTP